MAHVFEGERTWLDPVLRPVERRCTGFFRVDPEEDMHWRGTRSRIARVLLVIRACSRTRCCGCGHAAVQPHAFLHREAPFICSAMTPDLAFNTAVRSPRTRTGRRMAETGESYFLPDAGASPAQLAFRGGIQLAWALVAAGCAGSSRPTPTAMDLNPAESQLCRASAASGRSRTSPVLRLRLPVRVRGERNRGVKRQIRRHRQLI